ncbi:MULTISPECIES: porin family protein [unclassified Bacteroides]|jgi:hypothetical protein|uniref:porin family protein n=1 Tax=unclassified Bacteroides TaxID=2646097 RepID=UPI000E9046E5|nr:MULTISPECIES: porin family protein [unclassified Bacteroides]RGN50365.1 PorT family protein [Bacteroides sp. OM05-12]RHR76950.1 PorT family protein [Bacteroides sp. AF16-49]
MKRIIAIISCFCLLVAGGYAQQERSESILRSLAKGLEYSVRAGFSVGGTSPLPLPAEIREIESYNPTVCISLEGDIHKRFGDWGFMFGLRLETKGMQTDAKVKNYHMKMIAADKGEMEGNFTGNVKTEVRNTYLTVPLLATYRISPRWDLKLGPYFSFVTNRDFSGSVYDGYLRDGTPVGQKVEITKDNPATYDFSEDLRKFQWGAQLGAEWKAFSHLNVYADLTWGLNSIFKKDFKTITFDMYPIYGTLGFAYAF